MSCNSTSLIPRLLKAESITAAPAVPGRPVVGERRWPSGRAEAASLRGVPCPASPRDEAQRRGHHAFLRDALQSERHLKFINVKEEGR